MFFVVFFATIFLYGSKGSKHLSGGGGGGGGVQLFIYLFIYLFFFLGGGGLGGANPYFYRNLYNL